MSYDITYLQKNKDNLRKDGVPGELKVDGKTLKIEVNPRGAGSFFCPQPQLKLDFKNADTSGTVFAGVSKVKIFTSGTCLSNTTDSVSDKLIRSNYLIYRLAEEIFAYSYQARLAQISYVDTSGGILPYKQLAFFLENEELTAARTGLRKLSKAELLAENAKLNERIDHQAAALTHAFEFFIGNFDYGIPGVYSHILNGTFPHEKNIHLYADAQGTLYPLPFDYDFSRFVFYGYGCNLVGSFFLDSSFRATSCSRDDLAVMIRKNLGQFKFREAVVANFPKLRAGFDRWRTKYKADLDGLSSTYSADLESFIQAFELVIQESNVSGGNVAIGREQAPYSQQP